MGEEDFYYEETEVDEATYLDIFHRTSGLPMSPSHNSDGLSSGRSFASSSPATSPVCSTDSSSSSSSSSCSSLSYPSSQLYANSIDWNHFLADHNQLLRSAGAASQWLPAAMFAETNGKRPLVQQRRQQHPLHSRLLDSEADEQSFKMQMQMELQLQQQQQQQQRRRHNHLHQFQRQQQLPADFGCHSPAAAATSPRGRPSPKRHRNHPHPHQRPDPHTHPLARRHHHHHQQQHDRNHQQEQQAPTEGGCSAEQRAPSSPPDAKLAAGLQFSMQLCSGSPISPECAPADRVAGALCATRPQAGAENERREEEKKEEEEKEELQGSPNNRHLNHLNQRRQLVISNQQKQYLAKQTHDHTYNSPTEASASGRQPSEAGGRDSSGPSEREAERAGSKRPGRKPRQPEGYYSHLAAAKCATRGDAQTSGQTIATTKAKTKGANATTANLKHNLSQQFFQANEAKPSQGRAAGYLAAEGGGSGGGSSSCSSLSSLSSSGASSLAADSKLGQRQSATGAPASSVSPLCAGRRGRGENRKCRKVYGMERRDLWCTQCKWKKACSRFGDQ